MRPFVSGLVLAAGSSTRLGQPKQLLPFGATTLLDRVVGEANSASALDEVVVVIGGAAAEVRDRVDFGGAKVIENPEFARGCSASYRAGIGGLDADAAAVIVLLGEEPGVDRAVIDLMALAWRATSAPIMLAAYWDAEGHPLVFARGLFDQLITLQGDKAAWKIVDAHRDWIQPVPIDRPRPRGVNTWEEYEALVGRGLPRTPYEIT
jgi:molybdenum cofactor cytidylyltransferase